MIDRFLAWWLDGGTLRFTLGLVAVCAVAIGAVSLIAWAAGYPIWPWLGSEVVASCIY